MAFIASNLVQDAEDNHLYNLMKGSESECITVTECSSQIPVNFPNSDYIYTVSEELLLNDNNI